MDVVKSEQEIQILNIFLLKTTYVFPRHLLVKHLFCVTLACKESHLTEKPPTIKKI